MFDNPLIPRAIGLVLDKWKVIYVRDAQGDVHEHAVVDSGGAKT
jgi:hypothetical protein